MTERIIIAVMRPRERIWTVLCERTSELSRYLEHIESAELKSRETAEDGLVRCVHVWRARPNVPGLLAHHIDAGLLEWTCRTEWRAGAYESRWVVEPRSMKGSTLCEGNLRLTPAVGGRGTRVNLDLQILAGPLAAGWQAISSVILCTHFRKLVDAASRLIDDD